MGANQAQDAARLRRARKMSAGQASLGSLASTETPVMFDGVKRDPEFGSDVELVRELAPEGVPRYGLTGKEGGFAASVWRRCVTQRRSLTERQRRYAEKLAKMFRPPDRGGW